MRLEQERSYLAIEKNISVEPELELIDSFCKNYEIVDFSYGNIMQLGL